MRTHLYGEGRLTARGSLVSQNVIFTGGRDGNELVGQIVPQAGQRDFDATFSAELISGSEISGEFTWWDDNGIRQGVLHWLRVSPCGCEPQTCMTGHDCASDEACEAGYCHPAPESEQMGGASGIDQETTCTRSCECDLESECSEGRCIPREAPRQSCTDNCDCGHEQGELCVSGYCEVPDD